MAQTQQFIVNCGTGRIPVSLPIDRIRIPPGPPPSAQPLPDAAAAFRRAVAEPIGMPSLAQLVSKNSKVTIGIQDGRATNYLPEDHDLRILGLPILLQLLEDYGVRPENIQIKVANALHRMWTRKEMVHILGPRLPYTLGGRLSCIDATDKDQFIELGMTRRGMEVVVHRSVLESDLFIFMSTPQASSKVGGNPFWSGWGAGSLSVTIIGRGRLRRAIQYRIRRIVHFISFSTRWVLW
ncbi:MAG: DUF2088 domain-containing protein [Deltaproteobacteria bacterium]|nr:DUF2088 domain-containing protein [Deltaproteobacteria bacterium]